jgi:hypothetical protein
VKRAGLFEVELGKFPVEVPTVDATTEAGVNPGLDEATGTGLTEARNAELDAFKSVMASYL